MFETLTVPLRSRDTVATIRKAIAESRKVHYGGWLWECVTLSDDNVVTLRRSLPNWEAGFTLA